MYEYNIFFCLFYYIQGDNKPNNVDGARDDVEKKAEDLSRQVEHIILRSFYFALLKL